VKSNLHRGETSLSASRIELAQQALSNHYSGANVRIEGLISVRENSEIFHAKIESDAPFAVAIKCCLVPQTRIPDQSAAQEQFLALERVDNMLKKGHSRYCVPAPLYLMPELGTLVVSWVEGESLTRKLHRPGIFIKGPEWFETVGAWLGNFHKLGPLRRQRVNLNERLKVSEDLYASPLPDKSFIKAISILKKTAPRIENIEVEASWLHGDCKTDNFFLSGPDIYGFDISLCHENPVEYDLAMFFNNLDLLFSSPQNFYLAGMQSSLEKAFWRGYRSTGPSVSLTYLNWLRLNLSLSFWHTMLKGRKRSIRNWVLNRMFAKLAGRLSEIIDQSH